MRRGLPRIGGWVPDRPREARAQHADEQGRGAVRARRAPYSPDFNPIEQAFAKLKAFLRAARPRSFDAVTTLIGLALDLFSPTECANYIRNCGYHVSTPL